MIFVGKSLISLPRFVLIIRKISSNKSFFLSMDLFCANRRRLDEHACSMPNIHFREENSFVLPKLYLAEIYIEHAHQRNIKGPITWFSRYRVKPARNIILSYKFDPTETLIDHEITNRKLFLVYFGFQDTG